MKNSNNIWPLPFRRLESKKLLHNISDEEFYTLCRLVYRRACRHQSNDRQARKLVRRLIRRRKRSTETGPRPTLHVGMLLAKYKKNSILENLYPDRSGKWLSPIHRKNTVHFDLNNFSFVDAPNDTMLQLQAIASAECTARDGSLDFGDSQILDIGPYVVWGLMSQGMAPFLLGGKMDIPVQKVIEAVGLRKFMKMAKFKGLRDYTDVWAFPLKQRNPGTPTATPAKAISFSMVADQLVDAVNEWLCALPVSLELTPKACAQLNKITTEILDNAERHGGLANQTGDWYVAGFMARRHADRGKILYTCHIAIVNLGTTIAHNIRNLAEGTMRADLENYITRHRSRRGQSSDTLATLYAMQDGVSSLPKGRGGMGMMEMVTMVNALGRTEDLEHQPAITIISGRSCIRFAEPYKAYRDRTSEQKRMQPFNPEGSFDSPPDQHYVCDLDVGFPGTIVALRFSLDYQALTQRIEAND